MPEAGRDYTAFPPSNVVCLTDYRKAPKPLWERSGYLKNRLSTWRETKRWKALAATHEAARTHVNDLVAAGQGPDTVAYEEAFSVYQKACWSVLEYPDAKLRNLSQIIRCAADAFGVADPAYNHWRDDGFKENGRTAAILSLIYTRAVFAVG